MFMAVISLHSAEVVLIVAAEEVPIPAVLACIAAFLLALPMGVVRAMIMVVIFGGVQQLAQGCNRFLV